MALPIILASESEIRRKLLAGAGVICSVQAARIDEAAIRSSSLSEGHSPRDIADALADAKAHKIARRNPDALVIGCDQVLDFSGEVLAKPLDQHEALAQLQRLAGQVHTLHSAIVVYHGDTPQWRFVGEVDIQMRRSSTQYLRDYVGRNWQSIQHSVGCYKLEEEGARLVSRIKGDYFTVLGLPLIELLTYLSERGELPA